MPGFSKYAYRLNRFFLYIILALIVLFAGQKLIHYSKSLKFYNNYLSHWEMALIHANAKDIIFPEFSGTNHVQYMENLIKLMKKQSIRIPQSNTRQPYVYQIPETGNFSHQTIFVLCFEKKIILYGLSQTTFSRIDNIIDGTDGITTGKFKGKLQKDNIHYAGIWNI